MELDKVMSTLKSDISETYKVQIDCLEDSESDSYNKSDMKEKTNESIGLHEPIKSSMLLRAKSKSLPWYLINGLESDVQNILISLNNLYEQHEIKK